MERIEELAEALEEILGDIDEDDLGAA